MSAPHYSYYILILFICILSACDPTATETAEGAPDQNSTAYQGLAGQREKSPGISESYAIFRKKQIGDIHYELDVNVTQAQYFTGNVNIHFDYTNINNMPVTVDFDSGEIVTVLVNGNTAEWDYDKWFISFSAETFNLGKNTLYIEYKRPYSDSGNGLYQYVDGQTGRRYLYSNFEPYNANKLFPHFDQPNLRATYDIKASAPSDWYVITSTRENEVIDKGEYKRWVFPTSANMPSYIFPFHAGPYHMWESDGAIPLRLFARQEMAEYVVAENWFLYTEQSFGFFNKYYDYPYPFKKYDQIIVPDFNAGAMENLAAVTFAERLVSRGKKTEQGNLRIANIIAHEMAHMWFGNLVTMDWWSGLWLNESFATYMGNLAVSQASDFKNVWLNFHIGMKQWAYYSDKLPTTHAIDLPIHNTTEAFTNFDGITYGKGASVLKQLPFFIGEENFRRGVAQYIKKYAYGNTQLIDFIREIEKASQVDLASWTEEWLYQPGLNTIKTAFECDDENYLNKLIISQMAPASHPTLRQQRIGISLYDLQETGVFNETFLIAEYSGAKTAVPLTEQIACPELVFPNAEDMAYVKVSLDKQSQATLVHHLHGIKDEMVRLMLWESAWEAVQDKGISLAEYVNFAAINLPDEKNAKSLERIIFVLIRAYDYATRLALTEPLFHQERQKIEALIQAKLALMAPGSDIQKHYFDKYLAVVHSPKALGKLRALLSGETTIEGLSIDQDMRWQMILRLNQHGYKDYQGLTNTEAQKDESNAGKLMVIAAEAIRPDENVKQRWLDILGRNNSGLKFGEERSAMKNLFPSSQANLQEQYLTQLIQLAKTTLPHKSDHFANQFSRLFLGLCSEKSRETLEALIAQSSESPILVKGFKQALFENKRCLALGED
ncbi:MAG: aminopeptidase N [Agarilytica sp.]